MWGGAALFLNNEVRKVKFQGVCGGAGEAYEEAGGCHHSVRGGSTHSSALSASHSVSGWGRKSL